VAFSRVLLEVAAEVDTRKATPTTATVTV